jgi:hypothetical protein
MMKNKGQAEIMDGLILMLVAGTCSVVLLTVSSDYGSLPKEIYEETYAQKLAQNTLLSLYHITYLEDPASQFYKKSIMVAVSHEMSNGNRELQAPGDTAGEMIRNLLDSYYEELGWHFMFALTESDQIIDESLIASDPEVTDAESFDAHAGNPYCASAALTYPNTAGCEIGGSAGDMCYVIFEICTWLS